MLIFTIIDTDTLWF